MNTWRGAQTCGFPLVHANISSFEFSTDHVEGGVLTMTCPSGILYSKTSSTSDASRVNVSIGVLESVWKASSTRNLLHIDAMQFHVYGDATHCSDGTLRFLDALTFAPMKCFYCRQLSSIPTTARPYLASSLQVPVCLAEVCMQRLIFLELDLLGTLIKSYATFFVNNLVPTEAYRLFFSGFSNLAFVMYASSCAVKFGGDEALMCRVNMPSINGGAGAPLLNFGELLPELREASPLTLINVCEKLLADISMPHLEAEVFHHRFMSIGLCATVSSFTATLPIAVEDFWDDAVHAVKRSPAECTAPSIKLNVGDMIRLEVGGVKYAQQSAPFPEELSGVFSDCDMDSDTSVVACEKYTHAVVKNWNVHLKGVSEADAVKELLGLWMELRHMMNSIQRRNVVNCTLLRGGHYNLDRTGPWFLTLQAKWFWWKTAPFFPAPQECTWWSAAGPMCAFADATFLLFFSMPSLLRTNVLRLCATTALERISAGESNATGAQAEVKKKRCKNFYSFFIAVLYA
ncbi:hypothetical protein C3747_527g13 [Trypanosoma cruzi]|uniref:Uncharacterized protein n=1 Tax=Trypanosoma cruzi TaxID=5693 RepID=A0A2V2UU17_TRYCR|nr:hypothetical protein C3747_527g13 [Trypanosoma cruzi]